MQYNSQCLEKVNVKYVIKRLWHEIFHIVPGINPRPISALQLRCLAWFGSLGLIPGPIWKMSCNNILLLTNLLYYDYKCLCFINLLTGHYGIYGALIQGIMEKKWSIMKKNGANFNTLSWVLFLSFLTKKSLFFLKHITGDFAKIVMSEID